MNIIQVGANNGKDHVYDFVTENINFLEKIILIEPIPFIIDNLKNQYKDFNNKTHIENIAISHNQDEEYLTLYYLKNSNYEVTSFSKEHVIAHNPNPSLYILDEIKVPCLTINQVIEKYNIFNLDYLYIDTEGLDVHIIASIDFEKHNIKNIIFEVAHTDGAFNRGENYNQIVNYLQQLGYEISQLHSLDLIATKQ